jgi:L,D-transpeptidase catalytic domain
MFGVERGTGRTTMRIFMSGSHLFRIALVLSLVALCTSCAEMENAKKTAADAAKTAAAALHPRPAYWNGDGVSGPPKIVVSLSNQRAYFYKGKTVIGESNISTGKKDYETPPGKYRVIQKDEHHVSSVYGDFVGEDGEIVKANVSSRKDTPPAGTTFAGAKMPYFLRFTRGYGMHAGFVPRYRASHGCIRMPAEMAKHFFDAAGMDTPVIVKE